ncbi:tetratricopeptide repeat protein [Streptomyces sp. NPDC021139]|uniref:tetratricopeptide repeat protein n=1 Tax=unclassified Streptomyces TaxID=2593676 RepID=UPI00340BF387
MDAALLTALAEGGDAGRRAVEELARAVGLGAGASVRDIAKAAAEPERRDAVREWGEAVAGLLAAEPPGVAGAVERSAPGGGTSWYGGDHADFRGGVFLREVIGVQVVLQGGVPEASAGLPPRPGGFTGRERESEDLLRALDPVAAQSAASAAPLGAAVSGLGGIGKTALAVETAYRARERGWFPGGVLFLDLHGYDREPVSADQGLRALLHALGTPPEHIPTTTDERAALYRSTLAARAREHGAVLVLADNASSPDQVRPLLPGGSRHRVLVTSRDRLPQLGARLLPLDQLGVSEAYELLDRALRIADPEDSRVADDPGTAERLAGLCGHLPLALQIAAALLGEDPGRPVAELVTELAEARDRLDHLDDGERSVRAAFELSYRRLPPEQARLLRLLALAPGLEVSDEVVAALVGATRPPAREQNALARAHLLERGSARGWWRLHDLVREFGTGVVDREEGDAARSRVLRHYSQRALAADAHLKPRSGEVRETGPFRGREEALAWFDAERAGLVAAARWAPDRQPAADAVRLAGALGEYLDWRRRFDDAVTVYRAACAAAHQAGDEAAEADAWNRLGTALRGSRRLREAYDAHRRARDLHHALGHDNGRAMAVSNLGAILGDVGQIDEAVDAFRLALDLFRRTGDRNSEAGVWNNLALILRKSGRVDEALDALRAALDLYRETGDRPREGRAWHNYAVALNARGRTAEAVTACLESLDICEEFEDWHGSARTLYALALVHEAAGDAERARAHMVRAAEAYERAGSPEEAEQARRAARLTGPAPTGTPTPAAPPARTAGSAQRAPRPPGAPGNAGP